MAFIAIEAMRKNSKIKRGVADKFIEKHSSLELIRKYLERRFGRGVLRKT